MSRHNLCTFPSKYSDANIFSLLTLLCPFLSDWSFDHKCSISNTWYRENITYLKRLSPPLCSLIESHSNPKGYYSIYLVSIAQVKKVLLQLYFALFCQKKEQLCPCWDIFVGRHHDSNLCIEHSEYLGSFLSVVELRMG